MSAKILWETESGFDTAPALPRLPALEGAAAAYCCMKAACFDSGGAYTSTGKSLVGVGRPKCHGFSADGILRYGVRLDAELSSPVLEADRGRPLSCTLRHPSDAGVRKDPMATALPRCALLLRLFDADDARDLPVAEGLPLPLSTDEGRLLGRNVCWKNVPAFSSAELERLRDRCRAGTASLPLGAGAGAGAGALCELLDVDCSGAIEAERDSIDDVLCVASSFGK
jgi:hypothetical protein